jgi:GrpB-like predicted nucleotidyltransferase (UPF0157 family)
MNVSASNLMLEDLHIDDPEMRERYADMMKKDMKEQARKEVNAALQQDESFLAAVAEKEAEKEVAKTAKAEKAAKAKTNKGKGEPSKGPRKEEQVSGLVSNMR